MITESVYFFGMFFIYAVLLGIFLNSVKNAEYKKYYVGKKTAQSAAFLAVFLISFGRNHGIMEFWLMMPAFVCCFAGDVLLAFYNKYRKKKIFALGLLSFLAGHLFFIRWLNRMQPPQWIDFLFPAAAVCLIFYATGTKSFHTGRLRPCILIYTFFIAYLFSKSLRIAVSEPCVFHSVCALGSTLFLVSDILILFLYFYKKKSKKVHIFNLLTYYLGIFFLASCILFL